MTLSEGTIVTLLVRSYENEPLLLAGATERHDMTFYIFYPQF